VLPREGLGANVAIIEVLLYSFLVCCFSALFCYLWLIFFRKKSKKKVLWRDFLIIFLINFYFFYSCLVADLVRGWKFLTFAIVFFPLVFFVDSFFILLRIWYGKEITVWGLLFLIALFFVIFLVIFLRVSLWGLPK